MGLVVRAVVRPEEHQHPRLGLILHELKEKHIEKSE
jgi:hypothetical protein